MLFFVTRNGLQCVRDYVSKADGQRLAKLEFGVACQPQVRAATLDELVQHKKFGGDIPFDYRDWVEEHEQRLKDQKISRQTQQNYARNL